MIQYIELTGNKGTEDVSRALDPILQKNRGEIGGMIDQLTNVKGSAKEIPYDILRKEREYAEDLKAKYEAQLIAHSRLEKRNKELEKQIENERRKGKSSHQDLVRQLEEEKIARKTLESNLARIKEESAKSDLQKEKTIIDISLRYDKA